MPKDFFEISWSTLWRVFLMVLFVLALFMARQALIILFLAIIISSALNGPVGYLQEKRKVPRILGTILIFLIALAILALLLYTLIPIGIFELQNFLQNLKEIKIPILGALDSSQVSGLENYLGSLTNLADVLFSGGASFINVVSSIFGNLALIISTLIISFYLTVNQAGVEKFLRTILPITHEEYVIGIYLRARRKLGLWLRGQFLMMLIVGALTTLGLWILGVKYSFILGILAGFLEIVPLVGPVFAGALAFIVALSESWTLGFYVILLFLVIQQTESHFLLPIVMKKTVDINPVVVVFSIIAGAEIAGIIGMLLAVPVAVILQELIYDYERRKLRNQRLQMN